MDYIIDWEQLKVLTVKALLVEVTSDNSTSESNTSEVIDRDGTPLRLGDPVFILARGVYFKTHSLDQDY